jgi:hypothetical protein
MANRTFRIAFGIPVCIMGLREDIRSSGDGLAVGLVNQPSGIAQRATPSTLAYPFCDKAEVDRGSRSRSAIRNP